MASPKAKNRRHPLYNAGLSREDAAASPAGAGSTATYVHSSLWVAPALAPGSVHLERRREEGNAHRQRRSPFPLVLTTALNTAPDIQCSQRPQPPGQEKKKNRPANDTGKSYLHGRGERGKKKDEAAPRKVSLQHPGGFFALHTRQWQDALQLGSRESFPKWPPLRVDCSTSGFRGHPLRSSVVPLAPPALSPSPAVLPVLAAASIPASLWRRKGCPWRWWRRRRPRWLPVGVSPLRVAWWQVARWRVAWRWVARWNDAGRWHDTRWSKRGIHGGWWC